MLHPHPHLAADGPLVELDHVSAGYAAGPVIMDVSLRVAAGDFVGFVGPSGSGKTTLLRTLLGDTRVYAGSVRLRAEGRGPVSIGYVPQVETVDWHFPVTVEQVVMMGRPRDGRWLPWPSREERERAHELMDRLEIGMLARRHIRQLSGGQQQRVFLARAMLRDPALLLLDEPTSGVDIRTRDGMLHLLDDLNHQGVTILMTTHELNAVAAHLPWIVCVRGGIVAEGPPSAVFTPEVLRRTYDADMPVLEYEGMTLIAERPHFLGREGRHAHPAGAAGRSEREAGDAHA